MISAAGWENEIVVMTSLRMRGSDCKVGTSKNTIFRSGRGDRGCVWTKISLLNFEKIAYECILSRLRKQLLWTNRNKSGPSNKAEIKKKKTWSASCMNDREMIFFESSCLLSHLQQRALNYRMRTAIKTFSHYDDMFNPSIFNALCRLIFLA